MDWKLELVVVPVTDVDRAKRFYSEQVGFVVDVDHRAGEKFRVVQLTPPGSASSITVSTGLVEMPACWRTQLPSRQQRDLRRTRSLDLAPGQAATGFGCDVATCFVVRDSHATCTV